MKGVKKLVVLAVERSRPTRERGALTANEATVSVVCDCRWIEKPLRGYWIKLIRPRVERALKNERRQEEKRMREIGRKRSKEPGYQFRLPF